MMYIHSNNETEKTVNSSVMTILIILKLTGKSANLKCSDCSTYENREIKMQRKNSVVQYIQVAAVAN